MKKRWCYAAAGAVLGFSMLSNDAFASGVQTVQTDIVPFKWEVGGQLYTTDDVYDDGSQELPTSLNYKGTTYIPIRLLAETVGYAVQWNDASKTAQISEGLSSSGLPKSGVNVPSSLPLVKGAGVQEQAQQVQVQVDIVPFKWKVQEQLYTTDDAYDDGSQKLPTSVNYRGTTYIPIRLLAETLGFTVQWDDGTKTATISEASSDDPSAGLPNGTAKVPVIWSNPAKLTNHATLLAAPDQNAAVLAVLPTGTQINVNKEINRDWLQIAAGDHSGYIATAATDYTFETDRPEWEQKADAIAADGLKQLGKPYKFGASANQTDSFDCSSFMKYIYGLNGVKLPRDSREQSQVGVDVPIDQLRKGDLLFFTTPARKNQTGIEHIGHVAMYLGNGQLLHTFRVGVGVTVTQLDGGWKSRLLFAKRILN